MNRDKYASIVALLTAAVVFGQNAMAAVDTTDITAAITEYLAAGILVGLAYLAARWSIHAISLLRPKG